jgi:hypothetical protein
VRAQVDRDLTIVVYFDRLLGLIKNLGRHSHLYSSPKRFPVESHLLLGCSHKIPNWTSVTSGLSQRSIVVSNTTLGPC